MRKAGGGRGDSSDGDNEAATDDNYGHLVESDGKRGCADADGGKCNAFRQESKAEDME